MKLLRLKINDPNGFRSLNQGFTVDFLRNQNNKDNDTEFNPYILAGPNGCGKSNILEALAAIFYHIECIHLRYRPDSLRYDEEENAGGFREEIATPDAFELEYLMPLPDSLKNEKMQTIAHLKIVKKLGLRPKIFWCNRADGINRSVPLDKKTAKELLPKYILAYSSGENEILSLPFFKMRFIHFDEYRDMLTRDDYYGQAPEGRLVYLDDHFSQAILLSNLLLQPEDILLPFKRELGLKGVKEFRLIIGKHHYEEIHEDRLRTLSNQERNDYSKTHRELTSNINITIDKFKNCATSSYINYDEDGNEKSLTLDFFVDDSTKEAFRFHFSNSPLELFQAFQILYTLNYYCIDQITRARIYTSKNIYLKQDMTSIALGETSIFRIKEFELDIDQIGNVIYTRSLSDGEHQFIHSIGLCLLFKDEPCLFLLDEPETHFNPDWRANFISRLRECFNNTKQIMREMLITTHSPFLISDSKQENVLLFSKSKTTARINISRPDFNTFGASINKITMKAFGKGETIGGYAEQMLEQLKERFYHGESREKIIDETNKLFGESVEKILLINSILTSREDK
ncbi:restriction system-associated AAA family ATPase [Desulfosporosinus metallidurans]|uniref:ATPase AAA-type core domain-containing protein n=1 Tax=Desulfosporosinus metallidurans TaxID=1888891 RepID=A0A1Q8QZ73_9FIRM|nr:restriction system-associated AAA family ATPase [Desulfosporosinus metallidurans]OLN32601.1 hypothetical protein DSOL_1352 [Desulfosporosinus metallidurans]